MVWWERHRSTTRAGWFCPYPQQPQAANISVTPVRAMHDNHLERDGEQRMLSTMPAQHSRSMMHHP